MKEEQLTLGKFIEQLEEMPKDKNIYFDFCGFVPTTFNSWRGIYAELALDFQAIEWTDGKYTGYITVKEMLDRAKSAVGQKFEGYKGGLFLMENDTPLWISEWGHANYTVPVGIEDTGYKCIIRTAHKEL